MKLCPRCFSTNIKHSTDSYTCTSCGFIKKELHIVTDNEFNTNTTRRKNITSITQKVVKTKKEEDNEDTLHSHLKNNWKAYIESFQNTYKHSISAFSETIHLTENEAEYFMDKCKQLWFAYLMKWHHMNLPIQSIFTNYQYQQIKAEDMEWEPLLQQQQSSQSEQQQEQGSQPFLFKKPVQDIKQEVPQVEIVKTILKTARQQFLDAVNELITKFLPKNKKQFFIELCKLDNWSQSSFKDAIRLYARYLLENRKEKTLKEKIKKVKTSSTYVSIKLLREMAEQRECGTPQVLRVKQLQDYIFFYDLVYYLYNKHKNNTAMEPLIKVLQPAYKKKDDWPLLVRMSMKYFAYLQVKLQQQANRQKDKSEIPPKLDYQLIYSLLHIGSILAQLTVFPQQILQGVIVKVKYQQWMDSRFLETRQPPTEVILRATSQRLIKCINLTIPSTSMPLWEYRLLKDLQLLQFRDLTRVLAWVLTQDIDDRLNEDLTAVAIVLILVKLLLGLDNQPILSIMNWHLFKEQVTQNQLWIKINGLTQICQKSPLREKTSIKFTDLIDKLFKADKNMRIPTATCFSDLRLIEDYRMVVEQLIQEIQQQPKMSRNYQTYMQQHPHALHFEADYLNKQPVYSIEVEHCPITRQKLEFKHQLSNQIPIAIDNYKIQNMDDFNKFLSKIPPSDIILPCNNYEVIFQYKSVYECLNKQELAMVLHLLSQNRCSVQLLWPRIQQLQRVLIKYERQS